MVASTPLLRAPRQQQIHARDQLAHEDRLGEVVLDAQLQTANLVLDGLLTGEEHDGDVRVLRPILHATDELVAIQPG